MEIGYLSLMTQNKNESRNTRKVSNRSFFCCHLHISVVYNSVNAKHGMHMIYHVEKTN